MDVNRQYVIKYNHSFNIRIERKAYTLNLIMQHFLILRNVLVWSAVTPCPKAYVALKVYTVYSMRAHGITIETKTSVNGCMSWPRILSWQLVFCVLIQKIWLYSVNFVKDCKWKYFFSIFYFCFYDN